MTPNSAGTWDPRWEPTSRSDRARPLGLRHNGRDAERSFNELDLAVRVEPLEALEPPDRERVDANGWIQHARTSPIILSLSEPALVRRIEWRLGKLEPTYPGHRFTLLVPGNPESSSPRAWRYPAVVSLFALAVSIALARWSRKSGRGAKHATFDLI